MLETKSRHWWAVGSRAGLFARGIASILTGALSVLFGVLLIVWPAAGVLTLVVLIGIAAIAFGITLPMLGLRLRRKRRHGPAAAGHHHRPVTA
ncbi:DUF308 domain-containing protein [Virgisporangium aurantiacum]|uniref:Uncharacterized protein n=1 Tax=Virgisporangium aurantiacum TaxID=175570 RepID=A0A8J3ZN09_9ACTN|nr:DUF308 domain-containing protein [Virgisporangium aurantiacum]GIJ64950.1 hypothetical protein Vau01_124660 [Virgisporangium aurantiacum]